MKRAILHITVVSMTFCTPLSAAAGGDPEAGKITFMTKGCDGCHGQAGYSTTPALIPILAGRDEAYIIGQLWAFQAGLRSNPMMSPMATSVNEEEIINIAAYLAAQK